MVREASDPGGERSEPLGDARQNPPETPVEGLPVSPASVEKGSSGLGAVRFRRRAMRWENLIQKGELLSKRQLRVSNQEVQSVFANSRVVLLPWLHAPQCNSGTLFCR